MTAGTRPTEPGPGQARDLPLDAHLHTDLSPDSDVPLDLYAAQAVQLGIAELAVTDHLDFNPAAPAFAYAEFARRERVVRTAAERWGDRVAIRFGVEVTYERAYEDAISDHLARHAYDYIIGSVHAMKYSPYTAGRVGSFVAGKTVPQVVAPYFEEVAAAVRSGLFDTIGHLDYVKKYVAAHVPPPELAAHPEVYEPVLRLLVETGTALEVNSSGLRQAPRETYPAGWVVARFRELGGERVTAGSDAHRADWFAYGLEEAYRLAAEAGFDRLTIPHTSVPGGGASEIPMPARFGRGDRPGSLRGAPGGGGQRA
ncbi:MAG TPA: histidinol-phosphatase HisJ family protein [Candidatus Limnocylindrales bacterium]